MSQGQSVTDHSYDGRPGGERWESWKFVDKSCSVGRGLLLLGRQRTWQHGNDSILPEEMNG